MRVEGDNHATTAIAGSSLNHFGEEPLMTEMYTIEVADGHTGIHEWCVYFFKVPEYFHFIMSR